MTNAVFSYIIYIEVLNEKPTEKIERRCTLKRWLAKCFPAFEERNYHLHFWGQFVSFVGFWIQLTAQSWRVKELTQSDAKVGLVVGLHILVAAFVTPFGGVLADRKDKRKILYCMQAVSIVLCLTLTTMYFCDCESVTGMIVVSMLLGLELGIDNPTRNSLIPDLIKEENFGSGISLNGAMVMATQAIGPSIAALLLIYLNAGWAFVASAFAPLAVVITLPFMQIRRTNKKLEEHPVKTFFAGVKYTFCSAPVLRTCVIICGLAGMLGFSYRALLPGIAKEVYKGGPEVVGWFAFWTGLGAFIGAVTASRFSKILRLHVQRFIIIACAAAGVGFTATGIGFIVFSNAVQYSFGAIFLTLAGFGFTLASSTVRSASQIVSAPEMRGRVTGISMATLFGGIAIGNFAAGLVAKSFGCPIAMTICGISFLLIVVFMLVKSKK